MNVPNRFTGHPRTEPITDSLPRVAALAESDQVAEVQRPRTQSCTMTTDEVSELRRHDRQNNGELDAQSDAWQSNGTKAEILQ